MTENYNSGKKASHSVSVNRFWMVCLSLSNAITGDERWDCGYHQDKNIYIYIEVVAMEEHTVSKIREGASLFSKFTEL